VTTYPRLVVADPQLDERLPKVTPYLLRRADSMCARRLAAEFEGWPSPPDPVSRSRLREAFLNAARNAHATLGPPDLSAFKAPSNLEPEEKAVFSQACRWYRELFGDRVVETYLHDCDSPTESPRRGVRVGGWVDLTVIDADGRKELRQFELWDGRAPRDDPIELESVLVAVLRLAQWAGGGTLDVSWSDLVRGVRYERRVDMTADLPKLTERFESQLARVQERATDPAPVVGTDCGECHHVWRCAVHPQGINVTSRAHDMRPGIIRMSPTAFESWSRCRRAWRNQYLLSVAASDDGASPHHGLQLHSVLRFVHEHGSCRDPGHVEDVFRAHGAEARLRAEVERHAARCPSLANAIGHELDVARFHRHPWPPFMMTARLDAIWVHDGLLDVRDYKSGRRWYDRIAEDPRAKVQAWVAARLAEERGLQLRLRYEHLAAEIDEDPEPWEPDADDLAELEEELRQAVEAIQSESDWTGINDEMICRDCRYRSICPDSAAHSEPLWPIVENDQPESAVVT
jgi:PD-(D/E)XK nuclease superfamily